MSSERAATATHSLSLPGFDQDEQERGGRTEEKEAGNADEALRWAE